MYMYTRLNSNKRYKEIRQLKCVQVNIEFQQVIQNDLHVYKCMQYIVTKDTKKLIIQLKCLPKYNIYN